MPRQLRDSVVVITGAGSGIGRATALRLAAEGARLVLIGRRPGPLESLRSECEALAATALAVPTDVTDPAAIHAAVARAVDEFGRIDTWINSAGVYAMGRFEDLPEDVYRRVLEVNLFGTVACARAVLPVFRRLGGGALINVSSGLGRAGAANLSAYVTSKFAVRGFAEALRLELRGSAISVCTVYPASIDTPLYEAAGNYTHRPVQPIQPVYGVDRAAAAIVRCCASPRSEVIVGGATRLLDLGRLLPEPLFDAALAAITGPTMLGSGVADDGPGNLFEPQGEPPTASGGWRTGLVLAARRLLDSGTPARRPG